MKAHAAASAEERLDAIVDGMLEGLRYWDIRLKGSLTGYTALDHSFGVYNILALLMTDGAIQFDRAALFAAIIEPNTI
jgi:hypothetical protein